MSITSRGSGDMEEENPYKRITRSCSRSPDLSATSRRSGDMEEEDPNRRMARSRSRSSGLSDRSAKSNDWNFRIPESPSSGGILRRSKDAEDKSTITNLEGITRNKEEAFHKNIRSSEAGVSGCDDLSGPYKRNVSYMVWRMHKDDSNTTGLKGNLMKGDNTNHEIKLLIRCKADAQEVRKYPHYLSLLV